MRRDRERGNSECDSVPWSDFDLPLLMILRWVVHRLRNDVTVFRGEVALELPGESGGMWKSCHTCVRRRKRARDDWESDIPIIRWCDGYTHSEHAHDERKSLALESHATG